MISTRCTLMCDHCATVMPASYVVNEGVVLPEGWQEMSGNQGFGTHIKHYCPLEACAGIVGHQLAYGGASSCDVRRGGKPEYLQPRCTRCNDTGVIETGNNDLPCAHCLRGETALFNVAGKGRQTGAQILAKDAKYQEDLSALKKRHGVTE